MINIDDYIKNATLSKDKVALNAYRNLKSELQKVLTSKNAPKYSESLFLEVCNKYAKTLEDSIRQFSEASRQDLVDEYTSELEVIKKLLPEPVTAEELDYHLYNWADELNFYGDKILEDRMEIAIPKKEMKNAIQFLKCKFPTTDGKLISEIVKKYVI